MRIVFTEHAKRDLRLERVPLESVLATVLQPDNQSLKTGACHATRRVSIAGKPFIVRVTYTYRRGEDVTVRHVCRRSTSR